MTGVVLAALAIVVALLVVLVAGLLRSHAEVLKVLHDAGMGLDPDAPDAPADRPASGRSTPLAVPGRTPAGTDPGSITGTDPAGGALAVSLTGRGNALLAFLTSSCLTCRGFWDAFADPHLELPDATRLVIVTKSAAEEQPAMVARLAPPAVTTVLASEAWAAYGVPVAPYFILLGPAGEVLGEGAASTWDAVGKLLRQSLADDAFAGTQPLRSGPIVDEVVRDDTELRQAGVEYGHASLHPGTHGEGG